MMNFNIRISILNYIANYGPTDTRLLIDIMSSRFGTTRQRIAGNISWIVSSGAATVTVICPGHQSVLSA